MHRVNGKQECTRGIPKHYITRIAAACFVAFNHPISAPASAKEFSDDNSSEEDDNSCNYDIHRMKEWCLRAWS